MKHLVFVPAALMLSSLAKAQDTTTAVAPLTANYNPGIAGILFKLFVSLVLVIGLIYVSVFLLKKFNNRAYPNAGQFLDILGKSYLTPKQSLFLVKIASTYAVLGVSENSINLIKELSPEEADKIKKTPQPGKGFQNVLKSVLRK